MIMVQGSDLDIRNLKFLLLCFEAMSGLKINFNKSEVMVLGFDDVDRQRIADNLNCNLAEFPITYLGFPMRVTGVDQGPCPPGHASTLESRALASAAHVEGEQNGSDQLLSLEPTYVPDGAILAPRGDPCRLRQGVV